MRYLVLFTCKMLEIISDLYTKKFGGNLKMEQENPQIVNEGNATETKTGKNKKKWLIVISVIVAVIIIVAAVVLYVNLYKIPHDNAVSYFNNSVGQFNVAKAELENRNKKLDDSIASLSQVVYAEDIPVGIHQ